MPKKAKTTLEQDETKPARSLEEAAKLIELSVKAIAMFNYQDIAHLWAG